MYKTVTGIIAKSSSSHLGKQNLLPAEHTTVEVKEARIKCYCQMQYLRTARREEKTLT
jgi:hypothetical protein